MMGGDLDVMVHHAERSRIDAAAGSFWDNHYRNWARPSCAAMHGQPQREVLD